MPSNRLGRGLESLFKEHNIENLEEIDQIKEGEIISEIFIEELRANPYQPRKNFDDEKLIELTNSIKEHGVIQPIIVKKDIKGYIIIAGERRFRASKKAGIKKIPSIIRNYSDDLMMQHALIENLQRENLNPIEEAMSYKLIMQKLKLTQVEFAEKIGKSRTYISNMLRLLNLPDFIIESIENNDISVGHAKILAGLKDEAQLIKLAMLIKEKQISVRELENILSNKEIKKEEKNAKKKSQDFVSIEKHLNQYFGTKVNIKDNQGKGKLIIDYLSIDDLNRVLELIGVEL